MKKILILVCLLVKINTAFAQSDSSELKLQKIAAEKDDNIRIDLVNDLTSSTSESNLLLDLQINQKLLAQSQKNKDKIIEAMALSGLGYDYRSFGNTQKSLEYHLQASALARSTGNEKLIANVKINLALVYQVQGDYPKATKLYLSAAESGSKLNDYTLQIYAYGNLSEICLEMNKIDSALMYSQRDYELCLRSHFTENLSFTLQDLGSIQGKLGNTSLATSYFDLAVKEAIKTKSPKRLNMAYSAQAQYFHDNKQNDSSAMCAKKAIAAVQRTAFSNYSIKPAKLLLEIYKRNDSDSALKYSEIYRLANDSLFSSRTIQQTQLMTFEDELRQKKLEDEKIKIEEQRRQNLQYALIALCILIFIILFLLLSRSFISNTRLIEFLGVLALLIVFEFLNLLLHPFLEKVTNHTPVLMLLALVCIAANLIPLHHRIEKWSTAKLVEKNKKIRLANAKKTIRQLEGND